MGFGAGLIAVGVLAGLSTGSFAQNTKPMETGEQRAARPGGQGRPSKARLAVTSRPEVRPTIRAAGKPLPRTKAYSRGWRRSTEATVRFAENRAKSGQKWWARQGLNL